MEEAVYAVDAFPDDDLLWRIEWIGGVGYNASVPTDPLIDICLAQLPGRENNPLSARSRSSQTKRTVGIGVGLLPYIAIASVWRQGRPVLTNLAASRHRLGFDTSSCRIVPLADLANAIPRHSYLFGVSGLLSAELSWWRLSRTTIRMRMRAFEIVKATRISRGTVDKWLRFSQCPPLRSKKAPRPGMAEYLSDELQRLWDQGCQNASKLLVEIRKLGYVESYTSLCRFLRPWRDEKGQPTEGNQSAASAMRAISAQEGAAVLSKPKSLLNKRQSKIVEFLKQTPEFATMRHLILSFRSILRHGTVSSLRRWMEEAKAAGIAAISRFVRQLKRDQEAVENAVEHRWSNGPVEGHINRLKTVKRQMYGKAGFELLRSRILPLAA